MEIRDRRAALRGDRRYARVMARALPRAAVAAALTLHGLAASAQEPGAPTNGALESMRPYTGVYRLDGETAIGIERFVGDGGDAMLLYADYRTSLVRPLFRVGEDEFAMGPGFTERTPVEQAVRFRRNPQGGVEELVLSGRTSGLAVRVPSREEDVAFRNGDVSLSGTLILPAAAGRHPAVVLLHGSGPLTRHSFGPWPRFFASLGMAVLVFDKRGTGGSTGSRLDASTGAPETLSPRSYPDDLVEDALAALRFLRSRREVDARRVGFWGSSEGGMLATQAAARSRDVAFAIDSSGFMGPLWETILYQAGALARQKGGSESDVEETLAFTRLWMDVARTGRGYDAFVARRKVLVDAGRSDRLSYLSGEFRSLEQMRWVWDHVLAFSPLPALRRVRCPVLGVWGEADPLTDAPAAARAMRTALEQGGNRDVTVRVVPGAGHSLMETPSRKGMAPGVFDLVRDWLRARTAAPASGDGPPLHVGEARVWAGQPPLSRDIDPNASRLM